jgi:hypothetical protein
MKRTLLAVGVAVLVSMLYMPAHFGRQEPFYEIGGVLWESFILQTVFVAIAAAVAVNIRWWPRKKPRGKD